jgi:Domain of unknown function (DUF4389)
MSDVSQGPGWWIASDGKWYPPEQHPDYQPAPPPIEPGGAFPPMPPPGVPASPSGPPWAGPPWSGPPLSGPPSGPGALPLHLWVLDPPPLPRNRVTCAIRLIMVIPQAIVLIFVNIAVFFAVIGAWFVALVNARLAGGLREFIAGVLRWNVRVQSYFFFLTDTYPPYSLADEDTYPIRVAIPPPDELNRAAVLFRLFIAIPGSIVVNVLGAGLGIVSIGSWFVLLVTGELPRPLFEATRAVLRYQARFYCYFSMLTSEYPWGAMGDAPSPVASADPYEAWSIKLSSGGRTAMFVVIILGAIIELISRSYR